ncbi:MAG TPA: hypothetical protein PKD61_20515 [Polyangiaceae bacterium]|nr:hypothetical protein [Polyangiaceae bacterium]
MHRLLRPAFVLTVATAATGCTKPQERTRVASATVPSAPPTQAEASDVVAPQPTGQEPLPPPATKKRTVRSPLPNAFEPSSGLGPNLRGLNPTLEGRSVSAASDGTCYIELPPPEGTPPPPPGGSNYVRKNVDCPEAMQDPAWDTCLHGTLSTDGTKCECWRPGNPPPPPSQAECPGGAK